MSDKPILMCGDMVRATLEDRKTNTRRLNDLMEINKCPDAWTLADAGGPINERENFPTIFINDSTGDVVYIKPRWCAGDRLWVRETWNCGESAIKGSLGFREYRHIPKAPLENTRSIYYADGVPYIPKMSWRPSIHMPRWASRITLEVVTVSVERLQDISASDAIAEGIRIEKGSGLIDGEDCYMMTTNSGYMRGHAGAIAAFHNLWDSINAKRGYGWDVNPYVWVIEFRRMS